MARPKVLIATLIPTVGGVRTMTNQAASFLQAAGYEVSMAYYVPYRLDASLSVPSWRLFGKRPGLRQGGELAGGKTYELGVRFPELEWCRYLPSRIWRELIDRHDYHLVVASTILPALPIVAQGAPCLAWVASPYLPEWRQRRRSYPWYRKLVDETLDMPACSLLERRLLRQAQVLALSRYTATELRRLATGAEITYMPPGIDTGCFTAGPRSSGFSGRIGFVGRLDDPRKNIRLLLDALTICRQRGLELTLHLVGQAAAATLATAARAGVQEQVTITPYLDQPELAAYYRSLDALVIPSWQEGLAIVGLEAMACGCPVIATCCGGPEDYVNHGVNGFLAGFRPQQFADAICRLYDPRVDYQELRAAAARTVSEQYSAEQARETFWQAFARTFKR